MTDFAVPDIAYRKYIERLLVKPITQGGETTLSPPPGQRFLLRQW